MSHKKTSYCLKIIFAFHSRLLIDISHRHKKDFVYQYLLSLISNRPLPYFSCRTKKFANVERTFNNAAVYSKDFAAPHCRSFCSINHQRLLVASVSSYPYFVVDSFFAAQGTYHTVPYVLRHHRAIICWVIHECINASIYSSRFSACCIYRQLHGSITFTIRNSV